MRGACFAALAATLVAILAGAAGAAPARDPVNAAALTLTQPAHGSATSDPTPEVAGTAGIAVGDGPTVRVQVRAGAGGGGQPIRTLTANVDPVTGAWSVPVEPELPEGVYNVKAEQTDQAGTATETPRNVFTVDLTPPAAPAVTGPLARTSATSAEIGITHAEPDATFLCALDGGAAEPCPSPKLYAGLADGPHTVAVRARDAAGNTGPAAGHAWTVDTTPPVLALASPAPGSNTGHTTPSVSGTAGIAPGDAATVEVAVRQGTATTGEPFRSVVATVALGGAWSVVVQPALPPGTYTVVARQADDVGNASTRASTFTVDLGFPSVGLTVPASGSVTRVRTPRFAGTSDQAAVVVDLYAGSSVGGTPIQSFAAPVGASDAWEAVPTSPLADGVYTAVARATNEVGTTASSSSTVFWVDDTPPAFTSVPENQTLEQTAAGGAVAEFAVVASDALDPAPQVACTRASGSLFPPGTTAVTCTVTDWVGLTDVATFTVTVRNTIPPAPVAGFAAAAGNRVVRLSWRRPAEFDHARVVVSRTVRGKGNWKVILRSATATSFADRTAVNEREYVYRIVSVDTARNTSPVVLAQARPSAFLSPAWGAVVSRPPLLRWAKVPRTRYYNVQVWRGGRKILSRWPTTTSFRLSGSWRFQGRRYALGPGTYFAYAWPGIGPKSNARYGPLIGSTKFVVR